MESPRLNGDVLAMVCEFLTRVPDVLSFSLTCSTLRPTAIKRILSIHPISLLSNASIRRFHYFLFADVPARAPHVRALEFEGQRRDRTGHIENNPEDDSLLIEILASCLHLERISISRHDILPPPNDPLQRKPMAVDTLLSVVRSPLRMLTIHTTNPENRYWTPAALEAFLPRFAPTLEHLELSDFSVVMTDSLSSDGLRPSPSIHLLTQYPALRSLSIHTPEGVPLLDVFYHLFPSLDGTLCLHERGGSTSGVYSYMRIRTINQHAQQRHGARPWKKLDRLVCEPTLFHMLCLRCPIGLLMIGACTEGKADRLAEALHDNPVARLKVSLEFSPGFRMFSVLRSPRLGDTLTHLTLCITDTRHDETFYDQDGMAPTGLRWNDILDSMRSSLVPLQKLTHLRVVLHCNVSGRAAHFLTRDKFMHTLRNAQAVDLEGFSASLVRLLPSLRFVFITLSAWFGNVVHFVRWQVARAWRVAEPAMQEGKPILVGLEEEAAAAIVRAEELILSDADKVTLHMPED